MKELLILYFNFYSFKPFQSFCTCFFSGLLPRAKSELQRVMERKQREQHRQREMSLYPPSDLEIKLCLRQQRIQTVSVKTK